MSPIRGEKALPLPLRREMDVVACSSPSQFGWFLLDGFMTRWSFDAFDSGNYASKRGDFNRPAKPPKCLLPTSHAALPQTVQEFQPGGCFGFDDGSHHQLPGAIQNRNRSCFFVKVQPDILHHIATHVGYAPLRLELILRIECLQLQCRHDLHPHCVNA
jgi:hypothetical protein